MKPDLRAMRLKLEDPNAYELTQQGAMELLAYAEKLEAVAKAAWEYYQWPDVEEGFRDPLCDALRDAGWEV